MKALILITAVFSCCISNTLLAKDALENFTKELEPTHFVCQLCPHVQNIFETKVYEHDGQCSVCGMNLIEKNNPTYLGDIKLHEGSGNYFMEGGLSNSKKLINIFYHKPKNFNAESPILLVIPGAGRNAWNYRDSWVTASEDHNILILSPAYAAEDYDFAAYHMGGVISNLEFRNVEGMEKGKKLSKYRLKDEDIVFELNNDSSKWIFNDFDRIFDSAVTATGSQQKTYDLFGHSAGGQILHRLAIFKPNSKANRILASNSGSYTLPSDEHLLPFGISGTNVNAESLTETFSINLVLFIGEDDNEQEVRGTMLHTPIVDLQGLGRLSRGKYFFKESQEKAREINADFNWKLKIIENVGHDYRLMGMAASGYLYGGSSSITRPSN